jgi:hypothetical protein
MRACAVIFLLLTISAKCQEQSTHRYVYSIHPAAFLPNLVYNTGRLQGEVEKCLPDNRSLAFGLGYIHSYGPTRSVGLVSFSMDQESTYGYRTGVEYKKYFNRHRVFQPLCLLIWPLALQLNGLPEPNAGLYISGQLTFQQTFIRVLRSYTEPTAESYIINRVNPALLFRFGFKTITKNRIVVDQSIGLGAQYNKFFSTGNIEPAIDYGNEFFPALNYSFKVGIGRY